MDSSTAICWTSLFVILGVSGLFCHFKTIFDGNILLANTLDHNLMPHYVASNLVLHCLPMTLLQNGLKLSCEMDLVLRNVLEEKKITVELHKTDLHICSNYRRINLCA